MKTRIELERLARDHQTGPSIFNKQGSMHDVRTNIPGDCFSINGGET